MGSEGWGFSFFYFGRAGCNTFLASCLCSLFFNLPWICLFPKWVVLGPKRFLGEPWRPSLTTVSKRLLTSACTAGFAGAYLIWVYSCSGPPFSSEQKATTFFFSVLNYHLFPFDFILFVFLYFYKQWPLRLEDGSTVKALTDWGSVSSTQGGEVHRCL